VGQHDIEKPALPDPKGHGVSRFEPNTLRAAFSATQSEIRSSPVYAGHAIKPLMKLL
jgi:hypothetical protein